MSVTIKDISEHTGLAISTISKYINGGNVLPENQEKIKKAIEELKFSVNPFARSMKTNKSYIIGMVISLPNEGFTNSVVSDLQKQFMAYGYYCVVENSDNTVESQERIVNFLLSKNIDGLIFFNMSVSTDQFDLYRVKPIPVISIGRKPDNEKCDQILFDDYSAVNSITKYLLSKTDHIAFLGGDQEIRMYRTRYSGFEKAFHDADREHDANLVSFGSCTPESGYRRMKHLLNTEKRPQAVLVSDGNLAVGAFIAIKEQNLRIPEDIIVASFENAALPESCNEDLNLLLLPANRICSVASKLLMDKIEDNQDMYQTIQIPYEIKLMSE